MIDLTEQVTEQEAMICIKATRDIYAGRHPFLLIEEGEPAYLYDYHQMCAMHVYTGHHDIRGLLGWYYDHDILVPVYDWQAEYYSGESEYSPEAIIEAICVWRDSEQSMISGDTTIEQIMEFGGFWE